MRPVAVIALALVFGVSVCDAQDKKLLKTNGWGSLSGRVIDPKTMKPVADVVVFLKAPTSTYFPIHNNDKVRKNSVVIEMPGNNFLPRVSTHFPAYYDGEKMVGTGEKISLKNNSLKSRNIRATGNPKFNEGFNLNLSPMTELQRRLQAQPLPFFLQNEIDLRMKGLIYVFDHPYHAITKKDGTFTIPRVPAGAEVSVMAWQENVGWVLTRAGIKTTFKAGKNTLDFVVAK